MANDESLEQKVARLERENQDLRDELAGLRSHSKVLSRIDSKRFSAQPTIYLVEDDTDVLDYYQDIFKDEGFSIVTCENGVELAFNILNSAKPDLVITDLKMPHMDGKKVVQYFSEITSLARIPLMVVSGFIDDETIENLDSLEIPYLKKPVSDDDLIGMIHTLLQNTDKAANT